MGAWKATTHDGSGSKGVGGGEVAAPEGSYRTAIPVGGGEHGGEGQWDMEAGGMERESEEVVRGKEAEGADKRAAEGEERTLEVAQSCSHGGGSGAGWTSPRRESGGYLHFQAIFFKK